MNQDEQNILFNSSFTYLYQNQLSEINRISKEVSDVNEKNRLLNNLVDDEEKWIIDNCTPLFFIEKASNILQEYIRDFNVDKMLIEIIEEYKKNGINIYEKSSDGNNALRIMNLKKIEFATGTTLIIDGKYNKNIESIVNIILGKPNNLSDINVDFNTGQEIVFCLTLSFGQFGGHFALIFCKYENSTWQIGLVDPYRNTYIDAFKRIVRDIIDVMTNRLNSEPFGFGRFTNSINFKIGTGIQEMSYVETKAPVTPLEKYNIQTANNQDHFCFMWCVYFFEKFLIHRWQNNLNFQESLIRVTSDVNTIANEIFVRKLQIIKQYIIDLTTKNIIELSGSKKIFFNTYFPCIWYDSTVNNSQIITPRIFNNVLYNSQNFTLHKIENNNIVEIVPIDFLYIPILNFNNTLYTFKTDEIDTIFNSLSVDVITKFNIRNTDNIVKIFYCKLFDILKTVNLTDRNIVIPRDYYNTKVNTANERYFINNNININIADQTLGCKNKEATEIGKLLSLKDFSCDYDTYILKRQCNTKEQAKNCLTLNRQIQNRNQVFNNTRFRCKLKDNLTLEAYQETVYNVMRQKIENSTTLNRMQNPGLLVWFGTGTGKTLAASVVAKMFGYCMNFNIINKVIIISPKSAFINFKKELENRLNIMMNKFLKQDILKKKGAQESFYFHGKSTNIFLFTHPIFQDLFMSNDGTVNDDPNNYFNRSFLDNALLIVDECHNFTAYGTDGPKKSTIFMSDCCRTAKQVLLLTATPIVNTPFDLEILLSYLDARDIASNRTFTTDYFGKFDIPFFRVGTNDININENHLSLVETFENTQNWGNTNNKIGVIPGKNDIFINTSVRPTKTTSEIENYFKNRIIYYMIEDEPIPLNPNEQKIPKYNEKLYYIFWNTQREYNEYIRLYLRNVKTLKGNKEKENTNAFNSNENNFIWRDTDIMPNSILNIIKTRESLLYNQEINNIQVNLNINLRQRFRNQSYKYIIFCNFKENIDLLKEFLSNHIDGRYIGIIRGDTEAEERKNIASKYDEGTIKIIIISKAGEEGVDFKRTGVILLADGVWTSAEYDQILGRAVRKNSNKRLNLENQEDNRIDPNTIVPTKIECITLLLTSRYEISGSDTKYSGDLRQFKIILKKRAITKQIVTDIGKYFYNIMDVRDMVTVQDEIGQNETYNDGKKIPRRIKSKSRRRKRSQSKRRLKSKNKYRSKRLLKSKSTRRKRSRSKKTLKK